MKTTMHMIRRLGARLASTVVRGVVSAITDTTDLQTLQITLRFDDVADEVEHFQPFGLSFHPTKGSECVVLSVGASQDNLVALAASDRDYRPTGAEEGEGGLYTPSGWKVFCDKDGNVFLSRGKGAQYKLARDDRVEAELDKIRQAHNDHVHLGTGYQGAALSIQKPLMTYTPGKVGADKVYGD